VGRWAGHHRGKKKVWPQTNVENRQLLGLGNGRGKEIKGKVRVARWLHFLWARGKRGDNGTKK